MRDQKGHKAVPRNKFVLYSYWQLEVLGWEGHVERLNPSLPALQSIGPTIFEGAPGKSHTWFHCIDNIFFPLNGTAVLEVHLVVYPAIQAEGRWASETVVPGCLRRAPECL